MLNNKHFCLYNRKLKVQKFVIKKILINITAKKPDNELALNQQI